MKPNTPKVGACVSDLDAEMFPLIPRFAEVFGERSNEGVYIRDVTKRKNRSIVFIDNFAVEEKVGNGFCIFTTKRAVSANSRIGFRRDVVKSRKTIKKEFPKENSDFLGDR